MSVTVAVAAPAAGTVTCCPLPVCSTLTVVVCPSALSVTVQDELAAIPVYVLETVPPSAPAGITKSPSAAPLQVTPIVTSPCLPAALPVIVLFTTSEPGTSVYVSVTVTVAVPLAGIVTSSPLPLTATATVEVCPSTVSVTVQDASAGIAG